MSVRHKYIGPVLIFLAVYAFSYLFCQAGELLCAYASSYLSSVLPGVFTVPNPIHSRDEYEAFMKASAAIGATISVGLMNYVALRLDNKKFEFIIAETDGQYTISEGIRLYLGEFLASDIISSTVIIAAAVIAAYFIPEKLMDYGLIIFLKLGASLTGYFELWQSLLIAVLSSITARLLSVPLALRTWRALWLSGSV